MAVALDLPGGALMVVWEALLGPSGVLGEGIKKKTGFLQLKWSLLAFASLSSMSSQRIWWRLCLRKLETEQSFSP